MTFDMVRYYQFLMMHFDLFRREGTQADLRTLIPGLRYRKRNKSVLKVALSDAPKTGSVLEFGVFRGKTINYLASLLPQNTIYGFDSFEGFPKDDRTDWQRDFSVDSMPCVASNVVLVRGFFETSLPKFIEDTPDLLSLRLLHIDCDLYSSTKTIFEYLNAFLKPGSVIVFDELLHYGRFRENEFLAFFEFLEKRQLTFQWVAKVGKLLPFETFLEMKANQYIGGMKDFRARGYHQSAAVKLLARPTDYENQLASYRKTAETLAQTFPMH